MPYKWKIDKRNNAYVMGEENMGAGVFLEKDGTWSGNVVVYGNIYVIEDCLSKELAQVRAKELFEEIKNELE